MSGNKRGLPAAAFACGLVVLAALAGCEKEPSMASKSAAAFKEARKRGETIVGGEHGHGALTPGGGHEGHEMPGTAPEQEMPGMDHSTMPGMDHSKMKGMDHSKMKGMDHSRMAGMDHSKMPGMDHSKMSGMDHSKMSGMDHSKMPGMDHSKMEGMDHSKMDMGSMESSPEPVAVAAPPGQPAMTLRPDPLDAPAPTSVEDAQRSAEMSEEMKGMGDHGGHGGGTYRQVDAGRGPGAYEGSEPQTPAEPHHHDPPPPPPSGQVDRRKG